MAFILVKGEDVLAIGANVYKPGIDEEAFEISNDQLSGFERKTEIKWDGRKIVLKTKQEIDDQIDSNNAKNELIVLQRTIDDGVEMLIDDLIKISIFKESQLSVQLQDFLKQKRDTRARINPVKPTIRTVRGTR